MRDALDSLSDRRIILFGGKGGVGKTTISSLATLHFTQTRPVILFTTDPASNLADVFPERVDNLTIESVDAGKLYAEFLDRNLARFLEIVDRGTYLDREELRRFFELSLPGADELMSWMRIGELAETNPESLVVVDTAPTGHALRMLGSAEHFRRLAIALDTMQEKHRGMIRQFMRTEVRDAADEFIEAFYESSKRRREVLRDARQTAFVPVFLSEPWVVEQTLRLVAEVREEGIEVPFAILNRAIEKPDCDRCAARQRADADARRKLQPLRVVDFPRACEPIEISRSAAVPLRRPLATSADVPALTIPRNAKLLFFAGKGGVGKTTTASSVALQLAARDPSKRFTIVSVDPAHALRDVFANEPPPHNLTVEIIDTRAKWQRFRDKLGKEIESAIDALTPRGVSVAYESDALQRLIEIAPPGADELFAINRLADLLAAETQERIIVDTAPTGHFLRLIDLPSSAGEWVREFMRILLRYRDLIPTATLGAELLNASRSLSALSAALKSDRAAVFVVTRPERIVVAETDRLLHALNERGMTTAGIIANAVTPSGDCPCDRSMRRHEIEELARLPIAPVVIERRDAPVTSLAELARLVKVASDSNAR